MTIADFFAGEVVEMSALSSYLDGLEAKTRLQEIRSLKAPDQAKLFDAAEGFRIVKLSDFVPLQTPPLQEVTHNGKNSLPLVSIFQKRFCLPQGQTGLLWGYNEHPLKPLVGPGYFVARQKGKREVVIDYSQLPPTKPATWPAIVPNSTRLGRYVYEGLVDTVRRVSQHVTIGRAMREGKFVDNWFVLCRAEPPTT